MLHILDWWRYLVVNMSYPINLAAPRWTGLVPGWVTHCGEN